MQKIWLFCSLFFFTQTFAQEVVLKEMAVETSGGFRLVFEVGPRKAIQTLRDETGAGLLALINQAYIQKRANDMADGRENWNQAKNLRVDYFTEEAKQNLRNLFSELSIRGRMFNKQKLEDDAESRVLCPGLNLGIPRFINLDWMLASFLKAHLAEFPLRVSTSPNTSAVYYLRTFQSAAQWNSRPPVAIIEMLSNFNHSISEATRTGRARVWLKDTADVLHRFGQLRF